MNLNDFFAIIFVRGKWIERAGKYLAAREINFPRTKKHFPRVKWREKKKSKEAKSKNHTHVGGRLVGVVALWKFIFGRVRLLKYIASLRTQKQSSLEFDFQYEYKMWKYAFTKNRNYPVR